jgi:hypothetical protein
VERASPGEEAAEEDGRSREYGRSKKRSWRNQKRCWSGRFSSSSGSLVRGI